MLLVLLLCVYLFYSGRLQGVGFGGDRLICKCAMDCSLRVCQVSVFAAGHLNRAREHNTYSSTVTVQSDLTSDSLYLFHKHYDMDEVAVR